MQLRDEFDLDDFMDEDEDVGSEGGALYRARHLLVVVLAVGAFAWLAYYAYHTGTQPQSLDEVPLIEADDTPLREKPEDPGGMEIPHQDKTIYGVWDKDKEPTEEKILPLPEEPVASAEEPTEDEGEASAFTPADRRTAQVEEIIGSRPEEEKSAPETVIAEKAPAPKVVEEKIVEAKPIEKEVVEKPVPAPAEEPKAVVEPAPKKVEVKAKEVVAEKKKTPAPIDLKYRAQLGAFRSKDEANNAWERIRKANASALKPYNHAVEWVDLKEKGVFYRLQATGFSGEADVRGLCKKLSTNKQGCMLVKH